jgi:transposase
MPAPYSQDLRERVIGFMALGGSARAAATRFEVSISSAIRWAQRWRAEGHARPRAMGGDRRSRLSEHGARVLQLVAQQPDLTLREIRSALAVSCGITVGLSTVHRFLGAHNLTLKKTRLAKLNSVQFGTYSFPGWPRALRLYMGDFPNTRFPQDRCYVLM